MTVEWANGGEVRPPALPPSLERVASSTHAEPAPQPFDSAAFVAAVVDDAARLSDPVFADRAAALSELEAAGLMRDLRKAKVRAKDVDAFDARVKKLRRERERLAATSARGPERVPTWRDDLIPAENGRAAACFSNLCLMLANLYADRLSYDVMAERPCVDGVPVDDRAVSRIRRHLGASEGVSFGKEDVAEALALCGAEAREFHPVRDYLADCRAKWDGRHRLEEAATAILRVDPKDKLGRLMFKRTLIAMAARGLNPGVKVDTILILLGYQGQKKSTLFRTLGGLWFGDSKVDITDRKGQMVMSSRWIYEWPEVDRVFQKHSDSDIKAFVSQQNDDFIPMFGRSVKTVWRSWLAVGTTNKRRFLTDATGDRRVWILDLHANGKRWKVSARLVESMRDQLFGEAVAEYEAFLKSDRDGVEKDDNPHRWWLNDAEEAEREGRTGEFRVENAWAETVGKWLAGEPIRCPICRGTGNGTGRDMVGAPHPCAVCKGDRCVVRGELPATPAGRRYVTPALVMEDALGIPPERHRGQGPLIADTLAELGWAQGRRMRVAGVKVTPYYSPEANPEADEAERAAQIDQSEREAIEAEGGA